MEQFFIDYPVIATALLISCPMAAVALAGLFEVLGFEFWDD